MQFIINTLVSAVIIATVTQVSQRSSLIGALLVSLPITSILSLAFLYFKTNDAAKVSEVSYGIFWLVIPSLIFFLILPALLKFGMNFWLSLVLSCVVLALIYPGYSWALKKLGIFI